MDNFARMMDTYRWRGRKEPPSPSPSPSSQKTSPSFLLSSCEEGGGSQHVKVGLDDHDDEHHHYHSRNAQTVSSSPELRSSGLFTDFPKEECLHVPSLPPNRVLVFSANDTLPQSTSSGENEQHKDETKITEDKVCGAEYEVPEDFDSDSNCKDGAVNLWRLSNKPQSETCEYFSPGIKMEKETYTKRKVSSRRSVPFRNVKSLYFRNGKRKRKVDDDKKWSGIDDKDTSENHQVSIVKSATGKRKKRRLEMGNAVRTIQIHGTPEHSPSDGDYKTDIHTKESLGHVDEPVDSYSLVKMKGKPKTSAFFEPVAKPLGQRHILNKAWVPPVSVYALIQEELYRDPWKMRRVIWDLFDLCPTPEAAVAMEVNKIEDVIRPLGLQKKRAHMIQKFSREYLGKDWSNVRELHGIGKYATDAYAIFCEGRWREVEPEDHKLVDYWKYLHDTDGLGNAFRDDRSL